MTEQKDADKVALTCSVSQLGQCDHTLRWLFDGKDMSTSRSQCSVTVTFLTVFMKQEHYRLFRCEVTYRYGGKVQQFDFSPQSSGEKSSEILTSCLTSLHPDRTNHLWWSDGFQNFRMTSFLLTLQLVGFCFLICQVRLQQRQDQHQQQQQQQRRQQQQRQHRHNKVSNKDSYESNMKLGAVPTTAAHLANLK